MNKDNILRLANAIESAELAPKFGFNMMYLDQAREGEIRDHTGQNCPSVGCIASWAVRLAGTEKEKNGHVYKNACLWLGLPVDESACKLFNAPAGMNREDITRAQAVHTLRHLAATGEIVWQPTPAGTGS